MKYLSSQKFAIIGAGNVGTALGYLLRQAGHEITAIADKSAAHLKRALPYTGGTAFRQPQKAIKNADCILITTSDDAISEVCRAIAEGSSLQGKIVFHVSGAGGLDLLEPARESGAQIASIHPIQSFSSIDNAIKNIPGSVFGITADKKIKKWAEKIVADLGGTPIFISDEQKPLYHAAACLASNYLVSLLNVVEQLYESIGLTPAEARQAYLPLVYGSLKNIEKSGSIQALTGPIARGDSGTVRKHIQAINEILPRFSSLYTELGLIAAVIGRRKGTLKKQQLKEIENILKGAHHERTD